MALRFDKFQLDRVKQSPEQQREIAIAEIRAAYANNMSVYNSVAYLTHLFEQRPDLFELAEGITLGEVLGQAPATQPEHAPSALTPANTRPRETTRGRLHSTEVAKMRDCIFEAMERKPGPRSADEILDDAIAMYDKTDPEVRASKQKWSVHFAAWRQKEPSHFHKTYRAGSNSEKDSLWQLAKIEDESNE